MPYLGTSPWRREGRAKLTGRALYVDDLVFPDLLHGVTVRSSIAHGRIRKISFEGAHVPWKEITVARAADIPGKNLVKLIFDDQPLLAVDVVHHPEEPILLLAHADKSVLEEARRHVKIEYEALPAVFDMEQSQQVFKQYLVQKGDVDSVWSEPGLRIVEGEYHTGAQEQLYIEPNGMIAVANPQDGVTVWGSLQCPYYIHKGLCPLFALPEDKVRVIQCETGGGFGGKEEYPTVLAGHAALLAWKTGKPVKMIYDRAEDMVATTKRHPSRTRHRTAVRPDGKIVAMDVDFLIDGGAYATLSSVVLSRGTLHATGPYSVPNVRVRARAVGTNHPPHGAFRGFGAPQSIFALERHLDKIARELGLTPVELRRRNFVRKGESLASSQIIHEDIDMQQLVSEGLALADYESKRADFAREQGPIRRGIGLATFMHGSGFTGSGEKNLASVAGVEADKDGCVHVLSASTEIGQGTNTIFSQIVADALGLQLDDVSVRQPDTRLVPNSGPTVASRTTMVVGKLVESASLGLKQTLQATGLLPAPYTRDEFRAACAAYIMAHGPLKAYAEYKQPGHVNWDDEKYQGDAYGAYAWAIYIAQVAVDTRSYETRVEKFWALQEIGKVVHPVLAAGQIEGGVAQGIGYALYEKVVWKEGRMMNGQMTNYIMPTSLDVPPIDVHFRELPYEHGPQGAKGIGELPLDGPGPAILSAMENALAGLVPPEKLDHIPFMPEDLMELLP
jgi:CO/xanthine dehydrogenase Mo-binding subunit